MIWLTGHQGMLGRECAELFRVRGMDFTGTDRELDLTDPDRVLRHVENNRCIAWIVNCAAYTAVDRAEDDEAAAAAINAHGARHLARAAERLGAALIHLSTDYVFAGNASAPYRETDPTGPVNAYGRGKLLGESFVRDATPRHIIIRTSWLYGNRGPSFVHTMLRLMNERNEVSVVNDQIGAPTYTRDLAEVIARCIETNLSAYGVYHYSNEGRISWHDFALRIYRDGRETGLVRHACAVKPVPTAAFPTRAIRPACSLLNHEKIEKTLGLAVPPWEVSLGRFLREDYRTWNER